MEGELPNYLKAYNVIPMDGYVPHQSDNGDAIPNCCARHRKIFDNAKEWASSLPENEAVKFAFKTVRQVTYTEHCILKYVSQENAYEIISQFIEFNVFSFGSLKDYQPYIYGLFGFMKPSHPEDLRFAYEAAIRLDRIIFLWYKNSLLEVDIYMLRNVFQKWYNLFPFELSIFKGLKENYDFFYILLQHDLGEFIPETFTEALALLTEKILTQINTLSLYEEGVLDEPAKLKLEFIISERKMQLAKGYTFTESTTAVGYERILKRWFKDEKKFIDGLISIFKSNASNAEPPHLGLPSPELQVLSPELPVKFEETVERIWQKLLPYNLDELLSSKKLTPDHIKRLMSKHSGTQLLPYSIALFQTIGFIDYFIDKFCINKDDGLKKLSEIFESPYRSVKGNVNVMIPGSTENPSRYTSIKYLPTISKDLMGV